VKPAIFAGVSKAVMVMDDADELETIAGGVDSEEIVVVCEISLVLALVVLIFAFSTTGLELSLSRYSETGGSV
jgi:hypothetical protein